jgi:hypothetical protein
MMIPASEAVALTQRPTQIFLEGRLPLALEALTAKHLGLNDGQVIQAKTQAHGAKWWLQFENGFRLEIPREWAAMARLVVGDTIGFKVSFQLDGTILLRPVPVNKEAPPPALPGTTSAPPASPPTPTDRLTHLLMRPMGMTSLWDVLQPGLLETFAQRAGDTPEALAQWWLSRPAMAQLSAEQLRRWIAQSGWFNEALLAQGKSVWPGDTKTALRALLQILRNSHDGQAQLIDEALSDLESSQLTQAVMSGPQDPVMGLLLGFSDSGPVRLKFQRDRKSPSQDNASAWLIDLEMNESELGRVWMRSRLSRTNQLDMTMWAELESVVKLAQAHAPRLRQLLEDADLKVNTLQFFQGTKPSEESLRPADPEPGLCVDVRS